jgi:uridine kinase
MKLGNKTPPLLVAIVGGSGAGKSWLAQRLRAALGGKAVHFSLDDFYRDRSHLPPARRARINFDHPRAIDWAEVEAVLRDCQAGRNAALPCYDFQNHSRLPATKVLKPKPIVLMDGLWLLRRPSLRRWFGLGIFLDCPAHLRLSRRIKRDALSRGRTRSSVREQFRRTVEPMHARFVAPQRLRADVILRGEWGEKEIAEIVKKVREKIGNPKKLPSRGRGG